MLKLLIVDDEENVRKGISKYINWQELGFNSITSAKDGLEALEIANKENPDLVLCDIRMPKMNGLEFATELRKFLPNCKIIFLSGYADKEYLKAAIQLKAVDYIEKPLDLDEIKRVVQSVLTQLEEENQKKYEYDLMQQNICDTLYLVRQEIALELIKKQADSESLVKKYSTPILLFPTQGDVTAFSVRINWNSSVDSTKKKTLKDSILKLFNKDLTESFCPCCSGFLKNYTLVVIFANNIDSLISSKTHGLQHILNLLNDLCESYFSASVGCGHTVTRISALHESFEQAQVTVKQQFYFGVNKIYYSNNLKSGTFQMDKNAFAHFKHLLKIQSIKEAEDFITNLTDLMLGCIDLDLNKIKNVFFKLMLILLEIYWDLDEDQFHTSDKNDLWHEINQAVMLRELSELILSNLHSLSNPRGETDIHRKKVSDIMRFINEHYNDSQLSIKLISEQTYLTQTYLCAFFKKHSGKTLNSYITEVRLKKSKELLKNGSLKLYEVATEVGYSDAHYFSTLFKQQYGCLPSEYRERF